MQVLPNFFILSAVAHEDLSDVSRFVQSCIDSVGQLEILLFLHAQAGQRSTARQINDRLLSNLSSVENRLERLIARGLVRSEGSGPDRTYAYAPDSAQRGASVDRLALTYQKYRGRVIDMIFSSTDRMRNFSDAFRLKPKEEDNRDS